MKKANNIAGWENTERREKQKKEKQKGEASKWKLALM